MIYRETGQFKRSYQADQALFPIDQDRYFILAVLLVAFTVVPLLLNEYWLNAILLPFLIYSLAAIGLNILTGYCGQVSLEHCMASIVLWLSVPCRVRAAACCAAQPAHVL